MHHGIDPGAPGERYQVVVHVDAAVLADPDQSGQSVLEDGERVSAETSQRLACDASRVVMRHDQDGRIVEIGARTRTIPPALRRALQSHHIRHWAHGGPKTLSNLALLCRRHHRTVHEEGYQVQRRGFGALYDAGAPCTHTRVASSGWFGERLDVAYAIGVLHPLAVDVDASTISRATDTQR